MACFTLGYIEQLLIWLVALCVVVAIFKLLLPRIVGLFNGPPGGGIVFQIIGYIFWGVIVIFCIIIAFDLLSCLIGMPSLHGGGFR